LSDPILSILNPKSEKVGLLQAYYHFHLQINHHSVCTKVDKFDMQESDLDSSKSKRHKKYG